MCLMTLSFFFLFLSWFFSTVLYFIVSTKEAMLLLRFFLLTGQLKSYRFWCRIRVILSHRCEVTNKSNLQLSVNMKQHADAILILT